jgi:hypothetical protein
MINSQFSTIFWTQLFVRPPCRRLGYHGRWNARCQESCLLWASPSPSSGKARVAGHLLAPGLDWKTAPSHSRHGRSWRRSWGGWWSACSIELWARVGALRLICACTRMLAVWSTGAHWICRHCSGVFSCGHDWCLLLIHWDGRGRVGLNVFNLVGVLEGEYA